MKKKYREGEKSEEQNHEEDTPEHRDEIEIMAEKYEVLHE